MRIIAGEFRSRRLKGAPDRSVRPTPDRLRETLFSILAPRIGGAVFADLYAGCGTVGLEALSRGAERVIFVESSRRALATLRANIRSLGLESKCDVHWAKAASFAGRCKADIVFLDPPYTSPHEYGACLSALCETAPALVIAQHDKRQALAERYGRLRRVRLLTQGDNQLSFYEPQE